MSTDNARPTAAYLLGLVIVRPPGGGERVP